MKTSILTMIGISLSLSAFAQQPTSATVALQKAAEDPTTTVAQVNALVAQHADVNAVTVHGAGCILGDFIEHNTNLDVIKALVAAGADYHFKYSSVGTNLLMDGATNSNSQVIRYLIQLGLDVNEGTQVPIMYAVQNPNEDVTQALLEAHAYVNFKDEIGLTPVIQAAQSNPNPKVIEILKQYGARLTDFAYSDTAFEGKMNALMSAALFNPAPAVAQELINLGLPVDITNTAGETALMKAATSCNYNYVDGKPLFVSSSEVLKVLVKAHANVNQQTEDGHTVLMKVAAPSGSCQKQFVGDELMKWQNDLVIRVQTLLAAGADPKVHDDAGETAQDIAIKNNLPDTVVKLLGSK